MPGGKVKKSILPDGLDATDIHIIEALQENSRVSLTEIGRRLALSDVAVHYRLRKLMELGVIEGFTVVVNPEKLGFSIRATFGLQVDPPYLEDVARKLAEHPSFYLVWVVSGAHNVHAKAIFRDASEMQRTLGNFLHKLEGVKGYHMSILVKPIKEDFTLKSSVSELGNRIKDERRKAH